MEELKRASAYYKIELKPMYYDGQKTEVYIKGENLPLFLGDIGKSFYVKILDVNMDGFTLIRKNA